MTDEQQEQSQSQPAVALGSWLVLSRLGALVEELADGHAQGAVGIETFVSQSFWACHDAWQVAQRLVGAVLGEAKRDELMSIVREDIIDRDDPPVRDAFRAGARWAVRQQVPNLDVLDAVLASAEPGIPDEDYDCRASQSVVLRLVESIVAVWRADIEFAIDQGRGKADPLEYVLRYVRGDMPDLVAKRVGEVWTKGENR